MRWRTPEGLVPFDGLDRQVCNRLLAGDTLGCHAVCRARGCEKRWKARKRRNPGNRDPRQEGGKPQRGNAKRVGVLPWAETSAGGYRFSGGKTFGAADFADFGPKSPNGKGGSGRKRQRTSGRNKTLKVEAQECSGLKYIREAVRVVFGPIRRKRRNVMGGFWRELAAPSSRTPVAGSAEEQENAHEGCREKVGASALADERWWNCR